MLAASSIVHTGYLLLAFIVLSYKDGEILNIDSAYAIMFYLIAYLLSALCIWTCFTYYFWNKRWELLWWF